MTPSSASPASMTAGGTRHHRATGGAGRRGLGSCRSARASSGRSSWSALLPASASARRQQGAGRSARVRDGGPPALPPGVRLTGVAASPAVGRLGARGLPVRRHLEAGREGPAGARDPRELRGLRAPAGRRCSTSGASTWSSPWPRLDELSGISRRVGEQTQRGAGGRLDEFAGVRALRAGRSQVDNDARRQAGARTGRPQSGRLFSGSALM